MSDPIVVLGATGAQGAPVARLLLAAGREVRAVGRSEERLGELTALGAEPHPLDLADRDALARAFAGAAGAFVQLPFLPVPALVEAWATAIARALEDARVPLAVATLSGPAPTRDTGVASFDTKALARRVLRASSAPLVLLEPTIYLGNLTAPFSAPSVLAEGELRYPPFAPDHRVPWISVEDQARLAIAALARPDLAGRDLRIGRPLTGAEIAEGLAAALGRPVRHAPMTPAELGAAVVPFLGEEVGAVLEADYALLAAGAPELGLAADTGEAERELGIRLTDVEAWARAQTWAGAPAAA